MNETTEMEMFIEFCRKAGHYQVIDCYEKSWLPYKARKLEQIAGKAVLTDDLDGD